MTEAAGPLRVVPGSHRQARLLTSEEICARLPDEALIRANAGDAVALHHNLLHSGTRNTSGRDRRFFGFIYNLSTIRQEDNFTGPNCQALAESARRSNDRRLLRLLGQDPMIFPRQNSGFTDEQHLDWQRWHNEDTQFAAQANDAAATSHRVRTALATPQQRTND
jgi:hypothetical protein